MRKHGISAKRLDELHEPGVAKDNVAHFIDFIESISTNGELPKPKHSLRWHLERNKGKAFEWGDAYAKDPDDIVNTCLDRFREYGMVVNAKGLIYVERAVRIPDGGSNTTYYDEIGSSYLSVGECWSWKPGNAKSYCGGGRGRKYVVLKGWVSPDSINWQETMYINVYHMKDETEIRLSDASSAVVEIDEVEVDGRTIPFDGPRLTRADAVKYAHNPFHVAAKYRESGRESSWPKLRYNDGEIEFNKPFLYNGKFYIFGRDFSVSRLDLNKALADGADLHDLFDEVSRESEGFKCVRVNGKWNYLTSDNRILSEVWFDECWDFSEGFGRVRMEDGKENYIKPDGTLLSKEWFGFCWDFKEGFGRVRREDGMWNYIKPDGTLLSNVWFKECWDFSGGFGRVRMEDEKENYIKPDGTYLSKVWFKECWVFSGGFGRVRREDRMWSYIKPDGTLLSDVWYKWCWDFSEGFGRVRREDGKENYIKPDGTYLSEEWYEWCRDFSEGLGKVQREDNRLCKIDGKGNLYNLITGEPVAMNESLSRIISLMGRIC